jgi:fido (protein-threonine AMPylation protein)
VTLLVDQALRWLEENARDRPPVFLPEEIPPEVLADLRARDLAIHVPGGVIAVRNPADAAADVVRVLLWPIVEALARMYAPAAVERDSAIRLHLGRTDPGPQIRIRQTGATRWKEILIPGVALRVERGAVERVDEIRVGEASIPVDPAEVVLLALPIQFLRGEGLRDVALWLKSLVVSRPALLEAYRRSPRPVVLKRIEHIARDVGNARLADLLADVVATEQRVRIGRDRTGIGRELVVPPLVAASKTTRRPWLDRLRMMMHDSREQVGEALRETPPGPRAPLEDLVTDARIARANDAYHSTSIEGYRLAPGEVSLLLGGGVGGVADPSAIADVRSRMAIMGYASAFDTLIRGFESDGRVPLTESLLLDLHLELFRPSVEAGIVGAGELRGWRTHPVFIRDTLYVPPHPEKVPALMDLYFEELEPDSDHPLVQGTLAHLWLVWVHPFPDGNGRIARLLMNAAFLNAGRPWRTVRVDQRDAYFDALREAQLREDYAPFARFIAGLGPRSAA